MEKCSLFLGTNVLLFDVLTISIPHFVLFFSILSQKNRNLMSKVSATLRQAALLYFLLFYVRWTYILRGSLSIKVILK